MTNFNYKTNCKVLKNQRVKGLCKIAREKGQCDFPNSSLVIFRLYSQAKL